MLPFTLFACGAITDKQGFECTVIEGGSLPGDPSSYLNKYDHEKMREGTTYIYNRVGIDSNSYSIFMETKPINPNDQTTNRGSYIAVGILAEGEISLNSAIIVFETIAEVHGNLKSLRDKNNSFDKEFRLDKWRMGCGINIDRKASYLLDLLCKCSHKSDKLFNSKSFISYNDINSKMVDTYEPFYLNPGLAEEIKAKDQEIVSLNKKIENLNKKVNHQGFGETTILEQTTRSEDHYAKPLRSSFHESKKNPGEKKRKQRKKSLREKGSSVIELIFKWKNTLFVIISIILLIILSIIVIAPSIH